MTNTDLRTRIAAELPGVLDDLARLVAIPSISAQPEHADEVRASAEAVAALFRGAGCPDVRVVEAGGQPAVVGHYPAPEGRPTVCLYAHHDVQPTGPVEEWSSDPFAVTERDGRLYARGVADDKAGIAVHLAALRAFDGRPPVGVTIFVEGEEELGSPTMPAFLDAYGDELRTDAFVICDSGNWEVGRPSFTTTLRGLAEVVVEVRTLGHALHSGMFGGVVPDALTTLVTLLGTLTDADGSVAVDGLTTAEVAHLDYPPDRLRAETSLLDGVELVGTGSVVERLWAKPSLSVLALDATPVAKASNTLAPVARAKVSVRLAPNQDAAAALAALQRHLTERAPFGARVTFPHAHAAAGSVIDVDGPLAREAVAALGEAWGVEPLRIGQGGSIPLAGELAARMPGMEVLLTGVLDPHARAHGIDESLDLGDFGKAALGEALWLERLGSRDA